jgi:hypothetical protein
MRRFDPCDLHHLRAWYIGSALGFHPSDVSSILAARAVFIERSSSGKDTRLFERINVGSNGGFVHWQDASF